MDDVTRKMFETYLNENPLVVFSIYTDGQVKVVNDLGKQILLALDATFGLEQTEPGSAMIDPKAMMHAHGLFWLWVLGSYEIVRTMCGDKACFTPALLSKLQAFKKEIEVLRMPFAKQEYKSETVPVYGELSITSINSEDKDVEYNVKDIRYYMRPTMKHFEDLMSEITRADILKDHRDDDKYPTRPR